MHTVSRQPAFDQPERGLVRIHFSNYPPERLESHLVSGSTFGAFNLSLAGTRDDELPCRSMAWLVVLAVLVIPFVLAARQHRLAARMTLALFWTSSIAAGVWFLFQVRRIEADILSVQVYALPSTPGDHAIRVARPSQGSMKGTLRGGDGALQRGDLEKLRWSFAEPGALAMWFDPREDDGPEPGEVLLFYVDEWRTQESLSLKYRIEDSPSSLLKGRTLAVGHDRGAKHLLRDHAQIFLVLSGWGLLAWGALWMIVQVVREISRRRPTPLQGGPLFPS